jgi:hypothetical protein
MNNSIYLLAFAIATASAPAIASGQTASVAMLPDRTLDCTLGRALNLDPSRNQSRDEIRYEGAYSFSVFLPSIPQRQSQPPDPTEMPEPVNPATRILADPAGLASDQNSAFNRVVDMWPERVEMARTINPALSRLIIVSDIDAANGSANLFMAEATDAASMNMEKIFLGRCQVKIGSSHK